MNLKNEFFYKLLFKCLVNWLIYEKRSMPGRNSCNNWNFLQFFFSASFVLFQVCMSAHLHADRNIELPIRMRDLFREFYLPVVIWSGDYLEFYVSWYVRGSLVRCALVQAPKSIAKFIHIYSFSSFVRAIVLLRAQNFDNQVSVPSSVFFVR